jgi:uncharacterized protein YerC
MATAARGWKKTPEGREPIDDRMQQIVFQIRAGRPLKDIAAQFGVSLSRISHIRRAAGLPRRIPPAEST